MKWIKKFLFSRITKLCAEVVILISTSYLMIKKITDFSITDWLTENALREPLVNAFVDVSIAIIVASIVLKIVSLYSDCFPENSLTHIDPDEISTCLYHINAEINKHIDHFAKTQKTEISTICDQHEVRRNAGIISEAMAEHIRKAIKNIKVKKKDVFISLYWVNESNMSLDYILHFDSKRDMVSSKVIRLEDPEFSQYASVKCIKSKDTAICVVNKQDYAKSPSKRHKTMEHYIGCKLCSDKQVYGFLNVEFHNHRIFSEESEMQDFLEEHIFPFKFLFEYQFLKKEFFSHLKSLAVTKGGRT